MTQSDPSDSHSHLPGAPESPSVAGLSAIPAPPGAHSGAITPAFDAPDSYALGSDPPDSHPPDSHPHDRASITVSIVLVGIVLVLVLEIPSRVFELEPFGTPLTLSITGARVVSLLLVGLTCAGAEAVMRVHPLVRRRVIRYTFPGWVLPALATMALTLVLPESPGLFYWLLGLAAGGAIIAWLMLAHYQLLSRQEENTTALQTGQSIIAYLIGLVFFVSIYDTRLRSLVTATSVAAVSSLIAISILSGSKHSLKQGIVYAGVIGLLMGQMTWALNYWRANTLSVGVLMMMIFYVLVGIAREHMRATLNIRVLVEFLGVAALGVWVAIRFAPGN